VWKDLEEKEGNIKIEFSFPWQENNKGL